MGLYKFQGQLDDETGAGRSCGSVTRAHYDSERWQRGFLKLTNTAGVLSAAAGQSISLFAYGMGEDASGAGFIKSGTDAIYFSADDTNVHKNNGLHGVTLVSCGVQIGDPVTLTASSASSLTVLAYGGDLNADGYRDEIYRRVGEHFRLDLVRCADEATDEGQSKTFGLGSLLRNADHRGSYKDANTPNVGGLPGVPVGMARRFDIPNATSTERPFKVTITNKRAISIPARSSVVTNDLYVPVMVFFEVEPFSG